MSAPFPTTAGDPFLGRVVDGRYRVLRRLGEGGMGVVYEAEHLKLGKRVAIKAIAPERIGDAEIAARFTREAMATAQIEHPHIAAGFDYGLLPEGGAYLVAQLVRGTSLRERFARGATPWPEACVIASQIADALTAIHRAGYVHRDLTPENVLVAQRDDGSPHVYVLDLGVAALLAATPSPAASGLTAFGAVVGTAGYMAPEQALGRPLDPRADLYVVGVLLWEMIAGRPLFPTSTRLTEIVAAQLASQPAPPLLDTESLADSLPFDLERLLRDLLNPEPERRPQSAAELRTTLLRILGRDGTRESAREPSAPILLPSAAPPALRYAQAYAHETAYRVTTTMRTDAGRRALLFGLALGLVPALAMMVGTYVALDGPDGSAEIKPLETVIAAPSVLPVAPEPPPPSVHDRTIASLLHGRTRRERDRAAQALLDADPREVPPFAREVAALTVANRCPQRAAHLDALLSLGDPRAIPAIERLREEPTTGCGRRERFDCYACVRDRIEPVLESLRAR